MERKTCYIINFYLGDRRYPIEQEKEDKLCYVKAQIECLKKYNHSLSKIIFSFNLDNERDNKLFDAATSIIPKKIQNTIVEVIARENYGMSYAAWSDNFARLMDEYDYYIFNEDDYLIVQDNFDDYLVDKFNELPNCGYLCGLVREASSMTHFKKCAGMSAGISSYECLKKVFDEFGELPHSKGKTYTQNEMQGQVGQTDAIVKVGYELYDIREEYRMRFFWGQYIDNYFKWNNEDFFLSAKIYYEEFSPVSNVPLEKEYMRMENNMDSSKYFEYNTCYVVNCYFGERRFDIDTNQYDKLCYLKSQIQTLEKYKHSLNKIVFNFNVEPEHYPYLTEAIKSIPKKIQNADVEINIRENYGMSYGAWSDIFKKYQDLYDYYIFNEDDYVLVQDTFDKYLVDKFKSLPNCGYLCGLVRETAHYEKGRHAGMSSGISSFDVLKKVFDEFGELPHSKNVDYHENEVIGQTAQTAEIIKLGYDIYDIREDYKMRFWNGQINKHFFWNEDDLFLPAKLYYFEDHYWVDRISSEFLRMECDYKSEKYFEYGQDKNNT